MWEWFRDNLAGCRPATKSLLGDGRPREGECPEKENLQARTRSSPEITKNLLLFGSGRADA